ncbi:MAG: hypothetical protein KAI97_02200 [Gemmatimonadetes bacterium]|nr:hypothetical protein [Gemmatimonadota bacterium]
MKRIGLWLGLLMLAPATAWGQAPPCGEEPALGRLDFWLGDWVVTVGEEQVGTNRIEKILDGCAVMEHWMSATGGKGKSLFYYQSVTQTWKQVWVTQFALGQGGLKEKELVETHGSAGVRFQGEIPLAEGGFYLDRTTLTPRLDGTVRQVIQISRDGGESWETTFDAVYHRQE